MEFEFEKEYLCRVPNCPTCGTRLVLAFYEERTVGACDTCMRSWPVEFIKANATKAKASEVTN